MISVMISAINDKEIVIPNMILMAVVQISLEQIFIIL